MPPETNLWYGLAYFGGEGGLGNPLGGDDGFGKSGFCDGVVVLFRWFIGHFPRYRNDTVEGIYARVSFNLLPVGGRSRRVLNLKSSAARRSKTENHDRTDV